MQKVGVTLEAAQYSEFIRQMTAAKQSVTDFTAGTAAAAGNLRTYNSAAEGVAQGAAALKSRQIEVAQATVQVKNAQAEAIQALTSYRAAQTEGVQATTRLKTAQAEEVQELTKLRTAQTEGVEAATKLKTVQTESVQAFTKLRTAQTENVQAATQLKGAQTEAATALTHLRGAQLENVQAATQVKNAQVEETHAATQLKTAQSEAAQSLAKLRTEQTQAIAPITQLKARNLELDAALKQTKISTLQQSQAHETATKSAGNFGGATSLLNVKNTALALGVGVVAKSTLSLAAGFDEAMAKVQVATGITDRQSDSFKQLEAAARDVGGSTKFSATEAAEGLATLSQAGLNANQAIEALPAVAQAAQVNMVSMDEAAKTVTVAMNAFGLSASDATKIIDIQTTAAAAGVLNFGDFQQAIAAVGSVAKMSNQSLEGTTSVLLALTNNGQSAADAGTSVKSALLALTKPSDAARGAMDELGLKVYDASGKMLPFSDIIAQVEKGTKGMTEEQRNNLLATVAGSDGIRAFTGAMNSHVDVMRDGRQVTLTGSAALKEWEQQLNNSSGSTKKAADIMGDTFNAKVEKMVGNLQDAAIGIGQKLLPQLAGLVEGISKVIDKVQGFEESTHILSTLTSLGFKPLELAINAVLFVMEKVGEAVKFAQPYMDLLGATIQTKVIPPLKTLADIVKTPFDLLDQGLKKLDFGAASGSIDQLKAKIIEFKGNTDDATKSTQTFGVSLGRMQQNDAIAGFGDMSKAAVQLGNDLGLSTLAIKDLTTGVINVSATPIMNGIIAMNKFGDVSGSTSGQIKNVNAEITRLNALVNQSSQEMNDASGKMDVLDKMANNMSPDVSKLWNEWKNYNAKVAEGGVNSDMWSTKAEDVRQKLIALNPKLADVTSAYEIQSEKLKTATTSFEDNTVSMSLNEGKAKNLSQTLNNETVQAVGSVGRAALAQIPDFNQLNSQIKTTPAVTSTAMADTRNAIAAQNFASAAFTVGASVAQGIKSGINSQIAAVAASAASLVSTAISAAKAAGRISSPSKEAEERVGYPIGQGVAVGLIGATPAVIDSVFQMSDQMFTAMKTGMDAFNTGGAAELQAAMDAFDRISKTGTDKITGNIETIPPKAVDAMANFNTGGAAELQNAMNQFDQISKQGVQKFGTTIHLMPISTEDAIGDIKERFLKGAGDVQEDATDSAKAFLTNWSTGVKASVDVVPTTVTGAMSSITDSIRQGAQDWNKDVGTVPAETKKSMHEFTVDTQDAATAFRSAVAGLAPATKSGMDAISQVLGKTDFKPVTYDLGRSIMQGILDGMNSMLDDVVHKSEETVHKSVDAAKKAAEIHSPSKVMAREVGAPLVQGLAQGIQDSARLPQTVMAQKVIDQVAQPAQAPVRYPMSVQQMMQQTYNQQSYQNNYNLTLAGMGQSTGDVASDFAMMELMR